MNPLSGAHQCVPKDSLYLRNENSGVGLVEETAAQGA